MILFQFVFWTDSPFQVNPSAGYIVNRIFFIFLIFIDCAEMIKGIIKSPSKTGNPFVVIAIYKSLLVKFLL